MGEDTPRRRGGVGAGAGGARGLLPPPRRLRLLSWPLRRNAGRPRGPCKMRSQDATVTRQPAPPQASAFTAPRRTKLRSFTLVGGRFQVLEGHLVCHLMPLFAAWRFLQLKRVPGRSRLGTEMSFSFVKREKDHWEGGG